MNASTSITGQSPSRHAAAAVCAVRHQTCETPTTEILKKTLDVANSHLRGRDVAKELEEIGIIPFLTKALRDVGTANVKLTDAELAERKTKWTPRQTNVTSGALRSFAHMAGPAEDGAVSHPGAAHENQCYADI